MRAGLKILVALLLMVTLLAVIMTMRAKRQRQDDADQLTTLSRTMTVTSPSLLAGGRMPVVCTCQGSDRSPALTWESAKPGIQSYVVLMVDEDVPTPRFPLFTSTHWVIYNLPASVRSLPEGVTSEQMRLLGGQWGINSAGNQAYAGPCSPLGQHTYVFRIFALDRLLSFPNVPDRTRLQEAMQGHILDYGEQIGYFP